MKRVLVLGLAVVIIFAVVAALLLRFMPQPMKDSDYLVVGSVATLVSLLILFFLLVPSSKSGTKLGGLFLKRRKKH
jgi:Co/Zn/Cd efflux system component